MKSLLFSLPNDILCEILCFLSLKELCLLDFAVTSQQYRKNFHQMLSQSLRQTNRSHLILCEGNLLQAQWYLTRSLPVDHLTLNCRKKFNCGEYFSKFSETLTEVSLLYGTLNIHDIDLLQQCHFVENIKFDRFIDLHGLELSYCLQNFRNLKYLSVMTRVGWTPNTIPNLVKYCPMLQHVEFRDLPLNDRDLQVIVEGFPYLESIRMESLNLTDVSVQLLRNHYPRIKSIGMNRCCVSPPCFVDFVRDIILPNLLVQDIPTQAASIRNLNLAVDNNLPINEILSPDILQILKDFLLLKKYRLLFEDVCQFCGSLLICNRTGILIDSGILRILINSPFESVTLDLLQIASIDPRLKHHLVTDNLLSRFHNFDLTLPSSTLDCVTAIIYSLRDLIHENLVPIEDWIEIVPILFQSYQFRNPSRSAQYDNERIEATIHIIFMTTTRHQHVVRLVDYGLIDFWNNVSKNTKDVHKKSKNLAAFRQAVSHLQEFERSLESTHLPSILDIRSRLMEFTNDS